MKRVATFVALSSLYVVAGCSATSTTDKSTQALRRALTFHASFDHGPIAEYAHGDRVLYWAPSMKHPRVGYPGLPASRVVTIAIAQGRFGDALQFHKKTPEMVFFRIQNNIEYSNQNWSGTVSFWLKTDPPTELAPGFCDPIQITPREWNDAAFFVEFEKRTNSIPFRLGAYADFKIWNPANRDWNSIPFAEKPLAPVEQPPFSGDRWTHVAFTFDHFNTGQKDGVAKLYLNGKLRGALSPREQTFSWDPTRTLAMLGLNYIGLFDELAFFNRPLTDAELKQLFQLKDGVRSLHD